MLKRLPGLIESSLLKERTALDRYGISLALSLSFLLLSILPHYRQVHFPFSVMFSINLTASVLAAIRGGMGAALLSAFISICGIELFFAAQPGNAWGNAMELVHTLTFIFTAALLGVLVSCLGALNRKSSQAKQDAERSRLLMDELLAVVSHDLKAPLTAIALRADLLLRANSASSASSMTPGDPSAKRHLDDIKQAAGSMSRMIDHLLDLEKIRSGRLLDSSLRIENINELIQEVIVVMEPLASQKSITLKHSMEDSPVPVKCDRVRIAQVFSNLIENAIRYSSAPAPILIETRVIGDDLRCLVSDSGPGIEPHHLSRVFDRLWQAQSARHKGMGLGLSIVKGIIEAHGGQISVRSELDVGTTFVFTLPLATEARQPEFG
jgi:signal transduction histidine kinase